MPTFHARRFVWRGPDNEADTATLTAKYKVLRDHGVQGVFLEGYSEREFGVIKDLGMEAHRWMWTTNRGDAWIRENHPEWFMVSRSGKSCYDQPPYVDYYRWVNPVLPDVRAYLRERVEEMASKQDVDGVHLDYVRYPDVILPRALWEHYGLDQTEELPDYDFSYDDATCAAFKAQFGNDPRELDRPDLDVRWLRFRYDAVTKLVLDLKSEAHRHGKPITAAVFPTPSLARKICRQNWMAWDLDAFCPMIYHSFYNQPIEWVGECVRENIQSTMSPIIAGLYMPAFTSACEFGEALRLCTHRGASGVSIFGGLEGEYLAEFAKWAR